jgi:hypothetical protein
MDTYEAVYMELLSPPFPREGSPLPRGAVLKISTLMAKPDRDDPYARLIREMEPVPQR